MIYFIKLFNDFGKKYQNSLTVKLFNNIEKHLSICYI